MLERAFFFCWFDEIEKSCSISSKSMIRWFNEFELDCLRFKGFEYKCVPLTTYFNSRHISINVKMLSLEHYFLHFFFFVFFSLAIYLTSRVKRKNEKSFHYKILLGKRNNQFDLCTLNFGKISTSFITWTWSR